MFTILVSLTICLSNGGGLVEEMDGDEILKKSQEAYAALNAYVGTTTVQSRAEIGGTKLDQTASAKITFLRPGKIHIDGKDTSGKAFKIVSDGKTTWSSWALLQNQGAFKEVEGVELAVASKTGVAAGAPTHIPAILMKLGLRNFFPTAKGAKLDGREKIAGKECFKVVSETPFHNHTFWVDTSSFMIRQFQEEQDEKQCAELAKRVAAFEKKAVLPANLAIKSREEIHSFAFDNKPTVDEQLFQDPTKEPSQK